MANDRLSQYDGMYFIHSAIRRDLKLFDEVIHKIQVVSSNPNSQWHRKQFAKYVFFHLHSVHIHHHVEDDIFFPFLKAQGCVIPESLTTEHVELNKYMEKLEKLTKAIDVNSGLSDKELTEVIQEIKDMLPEFSRSFIGHLQVEEEICFKYLRENISKKAFDKDCLSKILAYGMKHGDIGLELGWMLSSDPLHENEFLADMPLPPRILYRTFWKKKYAKKYSKLLPQIIYSSTHPKGHPEDGGQCYVM